MPQPRVEHAERWRAPVLALLSYGFRPFFLGGAMVAALGVPMWLHAYAGGSMPAWVDPLRWHAHEMIFGYLAAIIAGFALTAVPNWTGRLPVNGVMLAALVALWLAGRAAWLILPPALYLALIDCAFLIVLSAALWREIIAGRGLRNAPVAGLVSLFAFANILFHAEGSFPAVTGYGMRLSLGVAAILIALIGGRITPSFTRNWMARLGLEPVPHPFDRFDRVAIAATAIAATCWVVAPYARISGAMLVLASVLLLARLARWQGYRALGEPIVLVLHLGYLWLAAALALAGLSALAPAVIPSSAALHALTAGAVGTMTLAVMTRASLGHTGREIRANAVTVAIYALVTVGALLRVVSSFVSEQMMTLLVTSGICWSGAFALFVVAYGPLLAMPGKGRI